METSTNQPSVLQKSKSPIFVYVVSGYLLLWVSVLNGYPVLYPDSPLYLKTSFTLHIPVFRTIGYSIFIRLVNLGNSPWPIVIAQSAIAVFVLCSAFKLLVREVIPVQREALIFLALMIFIAFGTTLPWFVGQIMPDVFTGLTFLSFFLLLYHPTMKLEGSVLTSLVFCLSIGVHITHLLAVSVLLVVVFVFRASKSFRPFWPTRSIKGIVALVLIPMMTVAVMTSLSNRHVGGFTLSPARYVFLFARLMESGLAPAYLQQRCKTEELTPCRYLDKLPKTADEFLWSPTYPLLKEMGGWQGASGEASEIVFGTIRYNPLGFVKECVKQMFRQSVTFAPGEGNDPLQSVQPSSILDDFREVYPGEMPRYLLSRQSLGKLIKDREWVAPIYAAVFWCSLGVNVMALFTGHPRTRVANQLFVLTTVFLFANAMATGALQGVHNRFQARASWLMTICSAAYVIPWFAQRQNKAADAPSSDLNTVVSE
jgi:hypothetical protein